MKRVRGNAAAMPSINPSAPISAPSLRSSNDRGIASETRLPQTVG